MRQFHTRHISVLLVLSILCGTSAWAQSKVTWVITDLNDEPLPGATVVIDNGHVLIADGQGEASGHFTGQIEYIVSYVGFGPIADSVHIDADLIIPVRMSPDELWMEEVTVNANGLEAQVRDISTGFQTIDIDAIAHLPFLLGEQDPVKFIQAQTGVSTGTDGNNGYYVRGGGIDQNKIELDHIELYNTNHLFGFFSMFNASAIKSVDFYKSGYPAQIGGRLSSTMQLKTINPNTQAPKVNLGVGILAVDATLEVPVWKNKSAALLSVRRSYLDLITQNLLGTQSEIRRRTDYRFSDFIFKYYHRIGKSHQIILTGFGGSDDYFFRSSRIYSNAINWKTLNGGLKWQWAISPAMDAEVYVSAGTYDQWFGGDVSIYSLDLRSAINNWKAGAQWHHARNGHQLTYGLEVTSRTMKPNQATLSLNGEGYNLTESPDIQTLEAAWFADDEIQMSDQFKFGLGLRISGFAQQGPFVRYRGTEQQAATDTLRYLPGDLVKTYLRWEPRFRINYLLDAHRSVRLAYDRNFQYIHLSPLSAVSLPTDIWLPSSEVIQPQGAHQWSAGYYHAMQPQEIMLSAGVFYKLLSNQMEYSNGAIVGYTPSYNFDDIFIFGKGRSYGLELSAQKEAGELKYQVSYTLSKTERSFAEVNKGAFFPAKYDRVHDLNVVASYPYRNWTFSGLFKLASGNALTLPTSKYVINENIISEYATRNAFRMPVYHRLDLAASLHPKGKQNVTWVFSVYNVYNRANPYYVYFDVKGSVSEYSLDINLEKVALFPVLPAVSYELRF